MRIILVGWGVVGQSLAQIFLDRKKDLAKKYGFRPRIVAVVDKKGAAINPKGLDLKEMLKLKKQHGTVSASIQYGKSDMTALEVIESVEAEAMIEVSPTNIETAEPGLSYIKSAFKTSKHVVTTNKGPLALALPALTELAEFNNVQLRFSGTVGAGTPVLEFAKNCLQGDKILSVSGILNGTTNYILTEMDEKHLTFDVALKAAQELGFAEADPTMDVDGYDAAAKLVIMANWIMDKKVTINDVEIKGIRDVSAKDIAEANKKGCTIKLIGSITEKLKVEPQQISKHHPLAVDGALNAVTFVSESAGEQTIIGLGAGGVETASAVLRDLLDIKQTIAHKMAT
ncbi:MAG: homoserine dehydrogenase [Candidatus Bathyarchaeota archaeon]|nr:homoserine dehydrogenase [Candidatus Bathyarchaeum tardum]WGM90676.1 MAG: homoserine dehydrogenase [Candidatus Bathyarchaeum tardum]WNZ28777.1 MAG: homoserine dehydrogenase [Candidatus Bathyarchaeota archaeon]